MSKSEINPIPNMINYSIDEMLGFPVAVARVIGQANMIEGILDSYIADFYTRCPAGDYQAPYLAFSFDILANRNITLNTKVDILFRIFRRMNPEYATKTYRKKYISWLEIRNKFAHGKHIGSAEGDKLFYGGIFIDAKELSDKFMAYQQEIMIHLDKYSELRGPYFNQIPTQEWEIDR